MTSTTKQKTFRKISERWELALQDLEELFQLHITVHDLYGMVSGPSGEAAFAGRGYHRSRLCQRDQPSQRWAGECVRHCHHGVRVRLQKSPTAFISDCPKGLSEAVIPIYRADQLQLVLFAGPFRAVRKKRNVKIPAPLRAEYEGLPLLSERLFKRLARLLELTGQGIITELSLYRSGSFSSSRKEQIIGLIRDNAHLASFNLTVLADRLHISPGRASHVLTEAFGKSFSEILVDERISRAKRLLTTTGLSAREIAERTGFLTPYYFNRVFKKHTATTPIRYRQENTPA